MNTYLYIQNCNPFAINKSVVYRVPTSNLEPRTSNPEKYIQSHNPFAMNKYLYIQNRNPFRISKTWVYTKGGGTRIGGEPIDPKPARCMLTPTLFPSLKGP
jgi:hypothetical protein